MRSRPVTIHSDHMPFARPVCRLQICFQSMTGAVSLCLARLRDESAAGRGACRNPFVIFAGDACGEPTFFVTRRNRRLTYALSASAYLPLSISLHRRGLSRLYEPVRLCAWYHLQPPNKRLPRSLRIELLSPAPLLFRSELKLVSRYNSCQTAICPHRIRSHFVSLRCEAGLRRRRLAY